MKWLKLILAGGVLYAPHTLGSSGAGDFGARPSATWERFSNDFMAIFSGQAKRELAQELRGSAPPPIAPQAEASLPPDASQEMKDIVRTVSADRRETVEIHNVIDTAEMKRRLDEQRKHIE